MTYIRMSIARRSLLAILQRTSAREVAARCGVTPATVSAWVSGLARPRWRTRLVLRAAYGITPSTWDTQAP